MIDAGVAFAEGMNELGAKVSSKSVVLASNMALAKRIARGISRKTGLHMAVVTSGRDLGLDSTMGKARRVGISHKRFLKAIGRTKKIEQLTKARRPAGRKLCNTGALPQASWGQQCMGMPPTKLLRLRRAVAKAAGWHSPGG